MSSLLLKSENNTGGIAIGLEALFLIFLVCAFIYMMNRSDSVLDGIFNFHEYVIVLMFTAIPMLIIILWFVFSVRMAKAAFRKASAFAHLHSVWSEENTRKEYYRLLSETKNMSVK